MTIDEFTSQMTDARLFTHSATRAEIYVAYGGALCPSAVYRVLASDANRLQ